MSSSSTPNSIKTECGSNSGSSGGSNTEPKAVLSTRRIGGVIYQLISSPNSSEAIEVISLDADDEHTFTAKKQQQKARKSFANSSYRISPHILGRTVDNSGADSIHGRNLQKPRTGVQFPPLNLTSLIQKKEDSANQHSSPELPKKTPQQLTSKISEDSSNLASQQTADLKNHHPLPCETEITINVPDSTDKSAPDQIPTNVVGPVAGILSPVNKRSLLGLMKKEYAAGLGHITKSGIPNEDDSANGSTSSDKTCQQAADSQGNDVLIDCVEVVNQEIPAQKTSRSPRSPRLLNQRNNQPVKCPANSSIVTSSGHAVAFVTSAAEGTGVQSVSMICNLEENHEMDLTNSDSIMNVEAAIAALHGEKLEDEMVVERPVLDEMPVTERPILDEIPLADSVTSLKKASRKKQRGLRPAKVKNLKPVKKATVRERGSSSRELDRLFLDEGAINMLCEMENKGTAGRRSGSNQERTSLIPTDLLNQKTLQTIRSTRLMRRQSEPPSDQKQKQKMLRVNEAHQQQVFRQWQALKNLTTEGTEVVYVPRQFANPADASQIMRRRSCTSDSSSEDIKKTAKTMKKRKLNPVVPKEFDSDTASSPLKDNNKPRLIDVEYFADGSVSLNTDLKEIHIRYMDHYIHVVLTPSQSLLPHSLNLSMLLELTTFLRRLKQQPQQRVILLTSAGSAFCTGVDFPSLLSDSLAKRQELAHRMASVVQDFIMELAQCDQVIVAGLNGAVNGLGLTLLPLVDMVYASDKATFYLPYAKLGQGTEGGVTLTLSHRVSPNNLVGSLVYEGRRLTATEAEQHGLVDSVLWPSCFQEDLIPRVHKLATQSTQAMLSTKKLLRSTLRNQLAKHLEEEAVILVDSWISDEFQRRARLLYESGEMLA